jgi:tetratricopeptide (TPR) repeat protein
MGIADLERASEISGGDDPEVLYELGLMIYSAQRYKKCCAILKLALRCSPPETIEPDIYYHIGLSYCHLEKFEKAIFPFSKCIEMVPSDVRYVHERAKTYQMIEDHENAITDFNHVITKNSKNAHAYFRRAFSLKAMKNFPAAAEDFETAKGLDPMNPHMLINHKQLKNVKCIVLCEPGKEKAFI